jgi:hypothetical protein
MEILSCSVIAGDRDIQSSSATSLTNSALKRAEGNIYIYNNNMLTNVDFSSLSSVSGYLYIQVNEILTCIHLASLSYVSGLLAIAANPALTFASLPRLSHVQLQILFCQNAPSFIIPNQASGTAALPGLTSEYYKGQDLCYLKQGSDSCGDYDTCP